MGIVVLVAVDDPIVIVSVAPAAGIPTAASSVADRLQRQGAAVALGGERLVRAAVGVGIYQTRTALGADDPVVVGGPGLQPRDRDLDRLVLLLPLTWTLAL